MPKLTTLKATDVIKKLKKLGFDGPYPGGRHVHMIKGNTVIPIPLHGGKELGIGLIQAIISEIGISREDRLKL